MGRAQTVSAATKASERMAGDESIQKEGDQAVEVQERKKLAAAA